MSLKKIKIISSCVAFIVLSIIPFCHSIAATCNSSTAEPVGQCNVCSEPGYRCTRKGAIFSCTRDETCEEEPTCTPKDGYCAINRDCCPGYICTNSKCSDCIGAGSSRTCSSSSDCCDPAICDNGKCMLDPLNIGCSKYGEPCDSKTRCCTGMTCNINTCGPSLNDSYKGPKITNWQELISPVARILYYGALFIGFCYVVISGYMLMTSEGDPKKTQDAQGQLTAAIIGIIFVLLSAAILRVIINSLIGGNISI